MIGAVHNRGSDLQGLLWYLYGPGRADEHENPRLVAGWRHPSELEPLARADGHRDFRFLTGLMELPLAQLGDRAPDEYVYHLSVRASEIDPDLGDGAWTQVAAAIMDRTGLCPRGEEDRACPWAAVHHGGNHVHIVAVLARQDGQAARLSNDYYQIGEACLDIEAEYGLEPTAPRDRTADVRPSPAEKRKAAAAGLSEPPRDTIRRHAQAAAAASRSEDEFFASLEQRGVLVRLHRNPLRPDEVVGYSAGLPGDKGAGGKQVMFPGRRLAADLSLVKLRVRWPQGTPAEDEVPAAGRPGPPGSDRRASRKPPRTPRARIAAASMTGDAERAALRRQVSAAAWSAAGEDEFFRLLGETGLIVEFHHDQNVPRGISGYTVSLPGLLHHRDHRPVPFGGGTLDPALSLGALRRTWGGTQPRPLRRIPKHKTEETAGIYSHAAAVARQATRQLATARGRDAADIAWAASDLVRSAAEATRSPGLRKAADGFSRAGRCAWGRVPEPSGHGLMLRTAAWLLSAAGPCDGADTKTRKERERDRAARAALIRALAGLARAVSVLRTEQHRLVQAVAARDAAVGLDAAARSGQPRTKPSRRHSDRTGQHTGPSR